MNRIFILSKTVLVTYLLLLTTAYAVPNLISYQGVLNDSGGLPISSTVIMAFSIYDAPTGGTSLWTETQSVQVANGIFNVELGSVNPLGSSLFSQDELYLGIQVASDPEMTTRQRLTTGSYSYRAASADSAAELTQAYSPVGAILAWVKDMPGVPPLPDGWLECNGQTISDPESPMNGQAVPNLNGRFLRGYTTSGGVGGSQTHNHFVSPSSGQGNNGFYQCGPCYYTNYADHLPPYYNVVWIIKIK